jgi:hypothetical protein
MGLDYLVPDKQIMREFSISAMTLYRWSHNKEMNFPVAIQINGRNFRSRLQTEAFKKRLFDEAMRARSKSPRVIAMHEARRARRVDRAARKARD